MGISKEQANENRESIISAAEKLFRQKGVDAVGLNDLMDAAGFTRGGFYNHFKSKNSLVTAVMERATQVGGATMSEAIAASKAKGRDALETQIDWYLSPEHRDDIEAGCPISGFAGDARRLDDETRLTYANGFANMIGYFADLVAVPGDSRKAARAKAIPVVAEMIGVMVLSRAVADAAPELSDEVLKAGRKHLRATAVPKGGA